VLVNALARSFLSGEASVDPIIERAAQLLGRNWRWLRPVARRYVERFAEKVRPARRSVAAFLLADTTFQRAWIRRAGQLRIAERIAATGGMQPVAAAAYWPVPAIDSVDQLARWLGISVSNLDLCNLEWLSDLKRINARSRIPQLGHYHYRVLAKSSASLRLIEAPKTRLKAIQRQILSEILELVPAHSAVHGFVRGRSIKTFASLHAGKRAVLRMDLRDFFPSIGRARIQALFRTMGYPESVANLLGGHCANVTPRSIWKEISPGSCPSLDRGAIAEASQLYARPHLPQGAPSSPALANLSAYRLDCRLAGLARAAGATYARYADDLAFSGEAEFDGCVDRFRAHAAAIVAEEGWTVNHRKTRIMRQGVRQHLVGLVTNRHVNVVRADFDRLKATLTNCLRHGASSQNRDNHPSFRMHLEGRVIFVESINPAKGKRLRDLFERIEW